MEDPPQHSGCRSRETGFSSSMARGWGAGHLSPPGEGPPRSAQPPCPSGGADKVPLTLSHCVQSRSCCAPAEWGISPQVLRRPGLARGLSPPWLCPKSARPALHRLLLVPGGRGEKTGDGQAPVPLTQCTGRRDDPARPPAGALAAWF